MYVCNFVCLLRRFINIKDNNVKYENKVLDKKKTAFYLVTKIHYIFNANLQLMRNDDIKLIPN